MSCCFCSLSQTLFLFLTLWKHHPSCPYAVCLLSMQAPSPLALVKLSQVVCILKCWHIPGTWTSDELPARAFGFAGVCSYWRNLMDLYKVIAGHPDLLTWPEHIYLGGPCGGIQRSSGPQLAPGMRCLCHCSSAQAERVPSDSSWGAPLNLPQGRNFSFKPAPLLKWAKLPQRALRPRFEPAPLGNGGLSPWWTLRRRIPLPVPWHFIGTGQTQPVEICYPGVWTALNSFCNAVYNTDHLWIKIC